MVVAATLVVLAASVCLPVVAGVVVRLSLDVTVALFVDMEFVVCVVASLDGVTVLDDFDDSV